MSIQHLLKHGILDKRSTGGRKGNKHQWTKSILSLSVHKYLRISKTVAVRIMKLAHRPRIASTTIKLISKPILLSILSTSQRIGPGPKHKSSPHAICLISVIRPTPFLSVSWIIWCCHLIDHFPLYYFLYLSRPYVPVRLRRIELL